MSATLQLANVFETPVILDMLPDSAAANQQLKAAILGRQAANEGVRKSNWNGWQSDTDMLVWGGEQAQRLAQHFLILCNNFSALPSPDLVWSVDMWANVSSAGAANEAHVHPGAAWSAVYYVDAGYGDEAGEGAGGELVLYDPRMPFVRMIPHDLRYRRPDGTIADSQVSIRPVSGKIIMFPPWLYHSVQPFRGGGTRISIAMNANLNPQH